MSSSPYDRMTERAQEVMALSLREALALGHNYIGTEHILLGLAREKEGLAGRFLERFGVNRERIRAEVLRVVGAGESMQTTEQRLEARLELAVEALRDIDKDHCGCTTAQEALKRLGYRAA